MTRKLEEQEIFKQEIFNFAILSLNEGYSEFSMKNENGLKWV